MTDDRDKVPWAHFLKKQVPGVDVYKGGATYYKGVWKPVAQLRHELGRPHQLLPGLPRGRRSSGSTPT